MPEEEDDWTVLSLGSSPRSSKVPDSPIEDDSTHLCCDTHDARDPLILFRAPDGQTNAEVFAEPDPEGEISTLSQENNDATTITKRVAKYKQVINKPTKSRDPVTPPQRDNWGISPCNIAVLVGIGCVGILAFLSMK